MNLTFPLDVGKRAVQSKTSVTSIHSKSYRFLQEHIYSLAGIVLEDDKTSLLESRLMPIVQ